MSWAPRLAAVLLLITACASPGGGRLPPSLDAMTGKDAEPEDPPPAGSGALETISVPASGPAITFATALAAGEIYLLKASGVVDLGDGQRGDAEYGFAAGAPYDRAGGSPAGAAADASADIGVDVGLLQINRHVHYTPTPPGPGRMKWTGYRDDHVYYMLVTGAGAPLSLRYRAPAAGRGAIAVALFPLSPAPPRLGPGGEQALDTVAIPIKKIVVASTLTTTAGTVYLLQASGAGPVGGGGLGLGDAEYMDWDAQGNRRNEGEAGADFGVGVDETGYLKMSGSAYTPRLRWWGPWRQDRTYYMLFTGTGRPIQFLYFDSGYGDNSPTDQLAVRIFAAP